MTTQHPFIETSWNSSQGKYTYPYVLNNPLKYTDPSGYRPEALFEEEEMRRRNGGGANGFNYFAGYDPRTGKYDPYYRYRSFAARFADASQIGHFSSNPGPTIYHDPITGESHWAYQDSRTGRYYRYEVTELYLDRYQTDDPRSVSDSNLISTTFLGFEVERVDIATNGGGDGNINSDIPLYFSALGIIGQSAELVVKEVKAAGKPVRLISKSGTRIGWAGEIAAIGIDLFNLMNNPSPGNYAQLQTTIAIAGLNFTGVGAAGSFAASMVDNAGAFNWYYNGLDKIHDKTGLIILPPGLSPFPIIIPSSKNR